MFELYIGKDLLDKNIFIRDIINATGIKLFWEKLQRRKIKISGEIDFL